MWLWTSKVVILNVQNDEIGFKTNLQKGGFFSSKYVIVMFVCLMVFNATVNNISVLLVEETGGPGENHRPVTIL
jgi:hypothetical protein